MEENSSQGMTMNVNVDENFWQDSNQKAHREWEETNSRLEL